MGEALLKRVYPYIGVNPEIAGGAPIIEGTRIPIRVIAGYYQIGMSVDEILTALPHITAAQVHSALAYYFDHQEEVDADLAASADTDFWKKEALVHPRQS